MHKPYLYVTIAIFVAFILAIVGAVVPVFVQSIGGAGGGERQVFLTRTCLDGSKTTGSLCSDNAYTCTNEKAKFSTVLGFCVIGLLAVGGSGLTSILRLMRNPDGSDPTTSSARFVDTATLAGGIVASVAWLVAFPVAISIYTQSVCEGQPAQHEKSGSSIGGCGLCLWFAWLIIVAATFYERVQQQKTDYPAEELDAAEQQQQHQLGDSSAEFTASYGGA